MKRYHVIVEGRVQGVGFRAFAQSHAIQENLTGSVRNMENGMVELYVQGEPAAIDRFLDAIRSGTRWIRVDDLTVKEVPVDPAEKKFRTSYSYGWY